MAKLAGKNALRQEILRSLRRQGFALSRDGLIRSVGERNKVDIRILHEEATQARISRAAEGLKRHEDRLLRFIAAGPEVRPREIRPVLREVQAHTEDELLFRYARLHWSIPVSAGYGRRLRYLVLDESNGKLIGLFGLGDPVFAIGPRDRWIGWGREDKLERLRYVVDAFAVGAIPPYSRLLCGKLVAMLMASKEVRAAFAKKYSSRASLISRRRGDGRIALITTVSALGRSSLYNRLRMPGGPEFISTGFTAGSGEFHLSNGLYQAILALASRTGAPTAKHSSWGEGWRSRREVLRSVLPRIGLPSNLLYHGVQREIFVLPLAQNSGKFLRREAERLRYFQHNSEETFRWFQERWMFPRARRDLRYLDWDPSEYRLWDSSKRTGTMGVGQYG